MFLTFFLREVKEGLKQPMFYIFFGLFALLVGAAVVSDAVTIGGAVGNVFRNAPHVVTTYTTVLCIFGILVAAAYCNNAGLRDYRYDFHEIIFTTPVSKSGYFFGRFAGAWVLSSLIMCGIFLGFIVGSWLGPAVGWIEPDQMGPVPWGAFVSNFFIFILPNMLFAGAIIFGLSSQFRSTMVSFVGALMIIITYIIANNFLSDIDNEKLAAMVDIFGLGAYSVQSKYFTPVERNTLSPAFEGLLLQNRLIWISAGLLLSGFFYWIFSFRKRAVRFRKIKAQSTIQEEVAFERNKPEAQKKFSFFGEFVSFFKVNFYSIAKSPLFRILFVFCFILVITSLWGGFEYFGLQSYPVTYKMMETISGQSSIFLLIIMIFYSGELVWRDRDVHIHEVIGASPYSVVASLMAKAFSLIAVIFLLYLAMIVVGIGYQLLHGFTNINVGLYLVDFLLDALPGYMTWGFILILIQVLINQVYIGYFVSVLVMFLTGILLSILDIESNMLDIGSGPSLTYSDMNGFGPGLTGAIWFGLYWILFGLLALVKAAAFWQRGVGVSFKHRMKSATRKLFNAYRWIFFPLVLVWVLVAFWIYYNTQVVNTYDTSDEQEQILADYEKAYKKYEHIPRLSIADAKYTIDIYPERRDVDVVSDLIMKNKTSETIKEMHFIVGDNWQQEIVIDGGERTFDDEVSGYQIYSIPQVAPGETINLQVKTTFETKGFENGTGDLSVIRNGTFFNNSTFLPEFGYNPNYELSDKFTRRKYDLEPKKRMPELVSPCGNVCDHNYLTNGLSDWINLETIISTSEDQIAVAPGSRVKTWSENGRSYFHYKVDHISQNFCSFMSADFEVARRRWKDVDIEIYYDEQHSYNIEMMLDAVQRSLEYYTEHFGPYFHKQARIIEFPRYSTFAQAFPGTMPYSEAFGFIIDLEDESKNNVIDAVIAHEMAHQWWAHQEIAARMQGGTMLVESFAEYSSLMVMKNQLQDDMKMKEFLKYDYNRYLQGRSQETQKELPLLKVENQTYIHYGKGSVVLYAIQDYIGEEQMNAALRGFLAEYRYADPPYPSSLDFIRYLKPNVPDSLQYLIKDWIEEITLYDLRLDNAEAHKNEAGEYIAKVDVFATKIKADSIGNETVVPIADYVDIGFYADEAGEELIFHQRVKLEQDASSWQFKLDQRPVRAAIDPRRMLIERIISDNEVRVKHQDDTGN